MTAQGYSAKVKALRIGSEIVIEGVFGPLEGASRLFRVRADPRWCNGVYTSAVADASSDVDGAAATLVFEVLRFCKEPNTGLMLVQAHGRAGSNLVPYVAVDGPPVRSR